MSKRADHLAEMRVALAENCSLAEAKRRLAMLRWRARFPLPRPFVKLRVSGFGVAINHALREYLFVISHRLISRNIGGRIYERNEHSSASTDQ